MLFSDVVATGDSAWTPRSGISPPNLRDEPEEECQIETQDANEPEIEQVFETESPEQTHVVAGSRRRSGEFSTQIRPKKMKRKMSTAEKIAKCLERMVNNIENDSV
ncbi:hypothetical protein Salat_2131300 [Sesamum alatum]|uniref:Uncharacterized protein n=1 Tax=Sesamum alatum TaxID=300844 RepID=A0AAE1Y1K1_9LAMI|nr:hypothetical protein Salat_2131300 [Sesamum alatum]